MTQIPAAILVLAASVLAAAAGVVQALDDPQTALLLGGAAGLLALVGAAALVRACLMDVTGAVAEIRGLPRHRRAGAGRAGLGRAGSGRAGSGRAGRRREAFAESDGLLEHGAALRVESVLESRHVPLRVSARQARRSPARRRGRTRNSGAISGGTSDSSRDRPRAAGAGPESPVGTLLRGSRTRSVDRQNQTDTTADREQLDAGQLDAGQLDAGQLDAGQSAAEAQANRDGCPHDGNGLHDETLAGNGKTRGATTKAKSRRNRKR